MHSAGHTGCADCGCRSVHQQAHGPVRVFVRHDRGERPGEGRVSRRKGAARPIAGEEFSFARAGVRPLPRQDRFQRSIQDDAVNAGLGAAYARVGSVLVVSDQSGDEDASSRRAQTIYAGIGDIDAGVVPARRDLVQHAFVVRDQDSGGADDQCIPLKSAHRKRRLDDVEFVLANRLDRGPQRFPERASTGDLLRRRVHRVGPPRSPESALSPWRQSVPL